MKRPLALLFLISLAAGDPSVRDISGVVLDPSGNALRGARVWLRSAKGSCILVPDFSFRFAETNAAGAFTLKRPADREMELYVEHPDYAATWASTGDGAVLRMRRPAYLTGTLPDNCRITATLGVRQLAQAERAGAFTLGPLPPGETITVTADSACHRPFQRILTLEAGERRAFRLPLDPGLSVTGRVVPAEAGVVVRASQGETRESTAVTDANGNFTLTGLREGCACVVVIAPHIDPIVTQANPGGFLEVRLDE